jgi:cytochrome c oxidase subunit 2
MMNGTLTQHAFSLLAFMAEPQAEPVRPKLPPSDQFWLPASGTGIVGDVDALFHYIMWVSVISVMGIFIAMFYFAIKYRAPDRESNQKALSQEDHSNALEITWSVIPLIIVISFFVWGFKDFVTLRTAPKNSIQIIAQGQKWQWTFKYPNGHVDSELHVPQGKNVRMLIKSVDVLHSLYLPEFRTKEDAVPGRYTDLWFNAPEAGEFPIFCAEYCGTHHSDMITKVIVHAGNGYEEWLNEIEKKLDQMEPVALGQLMFNNFGCGSCHTTDGTPKIGPSFKGVFGKTETLEGGGTVQVDENYIRESLMEPQKKIVKGFPPQMPSFKGQMSDARIDGIIAYIKSLK